MFTLRYGMELDLWVYVTWKRVCIALVVDDVEIVTHTAQHKVRVLASKVSQVGSGVPSPSVALSVSVSVSP